MEPWTEIGGQSLLSLLCFPYPWSYVTLMFRVEQVHTSLEQPQLALHTLITPPPPFDTYTIPRGPTPPNRQRPPGRPRDRPHGPLREPLRDVIRPLVSLPSNALSECASGVSHHRRPPEQVRIYVSGYVCMYVCEIRRHARQVPSLPTTSFCWILRSCLAWA